MLTLLLRLGAVAAAALIVYVGVGGLLSHRRKWLLFTAVVGLILYGLMLTVRPANLMISNVAVIAVATLAGCAVASLLPNGWALGGLLIGLAAADQWALLVEPLARSLDARESGPPTFQLLATALPFKGNLIPLVWVDDLAVCACVFYASDQLGLRRSIAWWVVLAALLGASWMALRPGAGAVPAIPYVAAATLLFIGVSWIVMRPRGRKVVAEGCSGPSC